jgi:hypothetical protein
MTQHKLVIWGASQVGKTSLIYNLRKHLNLEKARFKGGISFKPPTSDSYIIKVLQDNRITDDILYDFISKLDKDAKHLFIYRKNLLSQYLAHHHCESYDLKLDPDTLNIVECKDFITSMKFNTSRIYNILKLNQDIQIHPVSYEELFSDNGIDILNNNLGLSLKQEDKKIILEPIKLAENNIREPNGNLPNELAKSMGIEQYDYKKNFNELKDFFEDDYLLL